MKILFSAVLEAREPGTGRRLCDLFMFKPSKKDYPDYYKIILEPMDLKTVEQNIRTDKYATEEAMMDDMKLMFRNAWHYNEEGSQVVQHFIFGEILFLWFLLSWIQNYTPSGFLLQAVAFKCATLLHILYINVI